MRVIELVLFVALAGCGSSMVSPDGSVPLTDSGPPRDGGNVMMPDAQGPQLDGGSGPSATIHFVGRFDMTDPSAPVFAWPGSAILARFNGTTLSVDLDDGGNQFEVVIDGAAQPVLVANGGRNMYMLASGLGAGMHDVALTRRTESFYGNTTFHGFSGSPLVDSPGPTRLIEMIGDSITCGYGVLGDENCNTGTPTCSFSPDTEAETHAWGAFAAATLGAVNTAIAYSGRGVYRNLDGSADGVLPQLFERTFADDAASTWSFSYQPDAVVVTLGTNDFGAHVSGTDYGTAMSMFVQQIRGHYPDAYIVLANSPMEGDPNHSTIATALDGVVTSSGDAKVSYVDLPAQDTANTGCDCHPSEATHHMMADALVAHLRLVAGW